MGRFAEADYMPKLMNLCLRLDVGIVIPTLDPELPMYAEHRESFAAKGIVLIVSDSHIVEACNDKMLTEHLFKSVGLSHATTLNAQTLRYPLFVRPRFGSSGKDLHYIREPADFNPMFADNKLYVINAYLDPDKHTEFTCDLYYDNNHQLRSCVPRQRLSVRGGEVEKGITRQNYIVELLQEQLSNMKGARGCLTLQVFASKTSERIFAIEINPRFGGGYPLTDAAGATYVRWAIQEAIGQAPEFHQNWQSDLVMLRHDTEQYFEA